jgi:hypothetical protein
MFNVLWNNVVKYDGARRTTNVTIWRIRIAWWINKATCTHARTRLHTPTRVGARRRAHIYTHTYICYTCCFSTANVVSRTRLIFTLYVHCLSCLHIPSLHKLFLSSAAFRRTLIKECFMYFWQRTSRSRCIFSLRTLKRTPTDSVRGGMTWRN